MAKKISSCNVRIEDAAELMGMDTQTLRLCLQNGYYKEIGEAVKTTSERECWTYIINKFGLFQRLGLDVGLSTDVVLALVRDGKPPFIKQVPLPIETIMNAIEQLKKDTPTDQSMSV